LLYAVACTTGLRKRELASLQVRHLDLEQGGLNLEAAWTKNRKEGFQPLPVGLQGPLSEVCSGKALDEALLTVPSHTARSLDRDLEAAGIPKVTDEGKVDFHALRVTYTTLIIESGATVKEAQSLLRHATPDLTMNVYARTRPERMREVANEVGNAVQIGRKCAASVQRAVVGARTDAVNPSQATNLQTLNEPEGSGFDSRRLHHFSPLSKGEIVAPSRCCASIVFLEGENLSQSCSVKSASRSSRVLAYTFIVRIGVECLAKVWVSLTVAPSSRTWLTYATLQAWKSTLPDEVFLGIPAAFKSLSNSLAV